MPSSLKTSVRRIKARIHGVLDLGQFSRNGTTDEMQIFNIADFVTCLWGLDNNVLKLLQIRFYPVK